jgi:hypothetical protein
MAQTPVSPSTDCNIGPASADGQCLCGAVRFTAQFPSRWVAHCHCTRCQRAHGAAFVTWVGVDASRVSVQNPDNSLRWFSTAGGGDRGFCAVCGSSLFFRSGNWPGELHIARALFTDPVDRAPQAHAYYDTHVSWVRLADRLPTKSDPKAR